MAALTDINGIGPVLAERLAAAGIATIEALASTTPATLAEVQGLSIATATKVIAEAQTAVGPPETVMAAETIASAETVAPAETVASAEPKTEPTAKSKRDAQVAKLKKRVAQLDVKVAKLEKQLSKSIQAFKAKKSGNFPTAKSSLPKAKKKKKK